MHFIGTLNKIESIKNLYIEHLVGPDFNKEGQTSKTLRFKKPAGTDCFVQLHISLYPISPTGAMNWPR